MFFFFSFLFYFSSADLCGSTATFVKSVATLGNVEENDTVSRALARLSEVEEKVETLHSDQVNSQTSWVDSDE